MQSCSGQFTHDKFDELCHHEGPFGQHVDSPHKNKYEEGINFI